jgi:phage protein D
MPVSPETATAGPLGIDIKVDGENLETTTEIISVRVVSEVGRIPECRIAIADGSIAQQDFPASDSGRLKPGADIEVLAHWGDGRGEVIFTGLVIARRSRIGCDAPPVLELHCRGNAILAAQTRNSALFAGQTDSDVMAQIAGTHGLQTTIDATTDQLDQVLHDGTDWDVLRLLAERNGLWIVCDGKKLSATKPALDGTPPLVVTMGQDIIAFDAEVSADRAFDAATVRSWDISTLEVTQTSAGTVSAPAWGDLSLSALSEAVKDPAPVISSAAPLEQSRLAGYATQVRSRASLGRIVGTCRFTGTALAKPNTLLQIEGLARRFSGKAIITGVQHELSSEGWFTEVRLGRVADAEIFAPPRGLPPGLGHATPVAGLTVGIVMQTHEDPDALDRIKIELPVLGAAPIQLWARMVAPYAGKDVGIQFLPEVGDEVIVGFLGDAASAPVVLGSVHGPKHVRASTADDKNQFKTITTRSKLKMTFDDEDKIVTLETPGGAIVTLDDKAKVITMTDQNGNSVELGSAGITLKSPKDITLDATGKVVIKAAQDVTVDGLNIAATAQVGATVKGSATAELSASGQVTVKGAMVMIN